MNARIVSAVLAAGASRRLGRPKQLELHRGQPLVRWSARCSVGSRASASAVVIGASGEAVRAALAEEPVQVLVNSAWQEGIAASIRVAVRWAVEQAASGLLLTLCDQPRLSAAHLDRLIDAFAGHGLATASHYGERNGVPALFPSSQFGELLKLTGDQGASRLLNGNSPVMSVIWPEGLYDVDCEADLGSNRP